MLRVSPFLAALLVFVALPAAAQNHADDTGNDKDRLDQESSTLQASGENPDSGNGNNFVYGQSDAYGGRSDRDGALYGLSGAFRRSDGSSDPEAGKYKGNVIIDPGVGDK